MALKRDRFLHGLLQKFIASKTHSLSFASASLQVKRRAPSQKTSHPPVNESGQSERISLVPLCQPHAISDTLTVGQGGQHSMLYYTRATRHSDGRYVDERGNLRAFLPARRSTFGQCGVWWTSRPIGHSLLALRTAVRGRNWCNSCFESWHPNNDWSIEREEYRFDYAISEGMKK